MTPPRHNHLTRDIKPKGQCPACDTGYLDTPPTPEPFTEGYGERLMARINAEANQHAQDALEYAGGIEWAIFRRSAPMDASPFDPNRFTTRDGADRYMKAMFLPVHQSTLEPRARLVGEWTRA